MAFDLVARLRLQDDFSSKLQKATSEMGKAQKATSGLTSGVKRFSSTVLGISSAIGLTAAVAGGFRMVRNSMDTAFKRIDTMEQFGRVMNVMIGDTEKVNKILEATREAVTGTAYTLDGAASSVQNFVTRGVEAEKAVGYIEAWGDAVAFYGNGSQEQFDTVNDALGKMVSKGKVTMDQYDRIMSAGIPATAILAEKMGMSTAEIEDALSNGVISAEEFMDVMTEALMSGTEHFPAIAGAAKEAGASWGAVFGNMRTHIASGVEDIIKSIDKMLEENGLPDMRAMVKQFGETFRDNLKKVAAAIPAVVEKIKEIYDTVSPYFPVIKELVIGLGVAFLSFKGIMMAMSVIGTVTKLLYALRAGTLAATLAQMGLNTAMLLNPITWIIAGIAALIAIGVLLYRNWDTVKEKAGQLWGAIKSAWNSIETATANVWHNVKTAVYMAINGIIEKINVMIETINKIPGVKIPIVPKISAPEMSDRVAQSRGLSPMAAGGGSTKSHYHGIDYVPSNNYSARLHKGEAVLTASENKARQQGGGGGSPISISGNTFNVREESDIQKIAYELAKLIEREGVQMA